MVVVVNGALVVSTEQLTVVLDLQLSVSAVHPANARPGEGKQSALTVGLCGELGVAGSSE